MVTVEVQQVGADEESQAQHGALTRTKTSRGKLVQLETDDSNAVVCPEYGLHKLVAKLLRSKWVVRILWLFGPLYCINTVVHYADVPDDMSPVLWVRRPQRV